MPRSPRNPNYATIPIATPLISAQALRESPYEEDDEEEKYSTSASHLPTSPSTEKQWTLLRAHQAAEKELQTLTQKSRLRTKTSLYVARFRRFRWLIDFVLLLVNISLSALLLLGFWKEMDVKNTVQVGGDFGGDGPRFPTVVRRFERDERYVPMGNRSGELFEGEVVRAWEGLLGGGVWEGTEGDGGKETGKNVEVLFVTSMAEQLTCLFVMARMFSAVDSDRRERLSEDYEEQFFHCADYLRQGIMCSADLAMEPLGKAGLDGGSWDGYHVCKDLSHVMTYLEEQISDGIRTVRPIDG